MIYKTTITDFNLDRSTIWKRSYHDASHVWYRDSTFSSKRVTNGITAVMAPMIKITGKRLGKMQQQHLFRSCCVHT